MAAAGSGTARYNVQAAVLNWQKVFHITAVAPVTFRTVLRAGAYSNHACRLGMGAGARYSMRPRLSLVGSVPSTFLELANCGR